FLKAAHLSQERCPIFLDGERTRMIFSEAGFENRQRLILSQVGFRESIPSSKYFCQRVEAFGLLWIILCLFLWVQPECAPNRRFSFFVVRFQKKHSGELIQCFKHCTSFLCAHLDGATQ